MSDLSRPLSLSCFALKVPHLSSTHSCRMAATVFLVRFSPPLLSDDEALKSSEFLLRLYCEHAEQIRLSTNCNNMLTRSHRGAHCSCASHRNTTECPHVWVHQRDWGFVSSWGLSRSVLPHHRCSYVYVWVTYLDPSCRGTMSELLPFLDRSSMRALSSISLVSMDRSER